MPVAADDEQNSTTAALNGVLRDLAGQSRRATFGPREMIYDADEQANTIFLIEMGQVRCYQMGPAGSRRMLEILGPDDWAGEPALARLDRYGHRAEAALQTSAWAIAADQLSAALQANPAAAMGMVQHLARRLNSFREETAGLVFQDCNQRLIRTLQRLSVSAAASPAPEGVVLRITHEQLAQAVGVARETVSLALSQLRRRNLLRTGRNQLIFDPQRLDTVEP